MDGDAEKLIEAFKEAMAAAELASKNPTPERLAESIDRNDEVWEAIEKKLRASPGKIRLSSDDPKNLRD